MRCVSLIFFFISSSRNSVISVADMILLLALAVEKRSKDACGGSAPGGEKRSLLDGTYIGHK